MSVKKVNGYATVHCHGKKKGKIIHRFKTKKEAMAQHRAIQFSKRKRDKGFYGHMELPSSRNLSVIGGPNG